MTKRDLEFYSRWRVLLLLTAVATATVVGIRWLLT